MKKIKWLLFITIITAGMIPIQSCQSSKSTTAAKMLKFNFEKGKGYDYEMITSMDQEIMGQDMEMDMTAYYSMDVNDEDGETKTITSTIDRFKMKMGLAGFNIDVDTDKPLPSFGEIDGEDPMKMINTLFGAIKGRKFVMKVNAEGKVLDVTGFEDMAKQIVDSLPVDEAEREQMMAQFNEQFNAEKTKSQFERAFYIFPNKQVKVGDSWEKKTDIGMKGMPGSYNSTYTVTEIEGDMVTLEEKTKLQTTEEGMDMQGNIKGTIVVDSRSGLVVTADQDMTMQMEAEGKKFELKMKTKIKGKAR